MKTVFRIIAAVSLLLLFSCKGREGTKAPIYNADGLEGIGTLSLGLTTKEVEATLKENAKQFGKRYEAGISEYSLWYLPVSVKPAQTKGTYEERDAKYYLSKDEALDARLAIYKDTLVIIRISGGWRSKGAGYVRDAFRDKYGDGIVSGDQKLKYFGRNEVWASEKVTATYHLEDDENPNYAQRKILEYVEIVPSGRDIKKELNAYGDSLSQVQKEADAQRRSAIINGK